MKVIYPGSFDPITNGHIDIINRSCLLFDSVVIGVSKNKSKNHLFTLEERKEMIDEVFRGRKNIIVKIFDGLLYKFCEEENTNCIIRGLRAISDYEYELQMAMANKSLKADLETFFLVSNNKYSFLSSSLVKEIAYYGGSIDNLVPDNVKKLLFNKYKGVE